MAAGSIFIGCENVERLPRSPRGTTAGNGVFRGRSLTPNAASQLCRGAILAAPSGCRFGGGIARAAERFRTAWSGGAMITSAPFDPKVEN